LTAVIALQLLVTTSPQFEKAKCDSERKNARQRERRAEKAASKKAKAPSKKAKIGNGSKMSKGDVYDQVLGDPGSESDSESSNPCSAYIHVHIPPPPPIQVSGKPIKALQPQICKCGPFIFSSSLPHEDFLKKLAAAIPCRRVALPESELRWKFEKPLKGDDKPLASQDGYQAMVSALNKKKRDCVIIVALPPPKRCERKCGMCLTFSV
jgi:hypothetical protein